MRLASFNVENLFDRAKLLNGEDWDETRSELDAFAAFQSLLEKETYSSSDKVKIVEYLIRFGLEKSDTGPNVIMRRNRGQLVRRKKDGSIVITANSRRDWIGWIELRDEPVNERAILNTARVIKDVDADVIAVIEAENRIALKEFNSDIMPMIGGQPYGEIMLIDGNDPRGIDVGLMAKKGWNIGLMRSHVHDLNAAGQTIFSRDCPEFQVVGPAGVEIWVLVNHFKSKGFGSQSNNDKRRKAQAERVADIYRGLTNAGNKHICIVGDLNDYPGRDPLSPILQDTDLKDVSEHPEFEDGGFPGTYGGATPSNKIDYILLSPSLFSGIEGGGYFRKGSWPGVRPKKWEVYEDIESPIHTASDHHAVWVDINLTQVS